MGKPLMIQLEDDMRIEALKARTGAQTKIEVVRAGLDVLEKAVDRSERIERWKRITKHVAKESRKINREFRSFARFKRT